MQNREKVWISSTTTSFPRRIIDVLKEANERCDWRKPRAAYRQCSQLAAEAAEPLLLADIRAGLTQSLSAITPSYDTTPEQMAEHAFAIFADVDGFETLGPTTFRDLYTDTRFEHVQPNSHSRRLPTPFEAVTETCRRQRDACALRETLQGTCTSGILCGSTSYGAFHSVRGNGETTEASDLDIVLVLAEGAEFIDICERLSKVPGIRIGDVESCVARARIFSSDYDDGQSVFSHKLTMWSCTGEDTLLPDKEVASRYTLSLHVVPPAVLEYVLVESSNTLLQEFAGQRRTIRDYRDSFTSREDPLHTFAGRRHTLSSGIVTAREGYLRRTSAYYIDEADNYCPGFYQAIAQPKVDLRWDEAGVQVRFDCLSHKIAERVRYERTRDSYTDLRPSYANLRRGVFAPHVIKQIDEMFAPS